LLVGSITVGAFLLYGQEAGIFNEEEVNLLEGLAGDVSFALEYLANREAVDYLAYYDSLTGLANRTLLRDRLSQAVHFAERFQWGVTVMVVDLDRFKFVNDSLGHAAGDELLKVAAGRIMACVRDTDTVARIGGDEFVVVLAGMEQDESSALQVAQRMLERFAQPVVLEGRELFVTCSIGIASHPRHGEDGETLLKNADAAMYRAKDQGRNNMQFYTPEANARAGERLSLESGLRRALERDEFHLHYQPLVDLRTGQVCGLEALIRWQRPEVGIVPPAQFISLLEETGLILPIGDWVLRTACAQNKAWQDQGLAPVRIAVNLSAHQFRQQDLASRVQKALAQGGLEPRYLELELTESMLMRNVETTIGIMFELRQIGVRIALDDFGTGYSSLSYLKRFPIDTLKIDRSFVNEITSDPDSAAIADAIIAMAHSLHLTALAEGVETEGQLAWLRARGCEQMQGYLFSKPLPAGELEQLLGNRTSLPTPLRGPEGPQRIAAR
jgi:diguanylate cyclase (GGDEF)-like protein